MSLPIHVIGYGNPLCGDDGVGLAVVRHLAATAAPRGALLFEGGTGGLATLGYFEGCWRAVVVDAMRTGAAPGVVRRLAVGTSPGAPASLHLVGVASVLAAVAALGGAPPEVIVIGVEVAILEPGALGLSPAVASAVGRAAAEVRRVCALRAR